MPPIFVFDVNETLLDLSGFNSVFERNFGSASIWKEWFKEVLQLAFVTTITRVYSDFSAIGEAALKVVEKRHDKHLTEQERAGTLETLRKLSPHPDVKPGLERLHSSGLRLMALTNSTLATAELQLASAGVRHYFERVFSADTVHRLKPAPEPYHMVASELDVGMRSLLLVAAHSWDVAGAMRAGWSAAFLARPGQALDALTPKPNFIARDLLDLAGQIFEPR